MSPLAVALTVVVLLMSWLMTRVYSDERYTCPSCGATDEDGHADECPWKR
jgi:hypothetical protein